MCRAVCDSEAAGPLKRALQEGNASERLQPWLAGWQLHCSLLSKQLITVEISGWTLGIVQLSGRPGPYLAGGR